MSCRRSGRKPRPRKSGSFLTGTFLAGCPDPAHLQHHGPGLRGILRGPQDPGGGDHAQDGPGHLPAAGRAGVLRQRLRHDRGGDSRVRVRRGRRRARAAAADGERAAAVGAGLRPGQLTGAGRPVCGVEHPAVGPQGRRAGQRHHDQRLLRPAPVVPVRAEAAGPGKGATSRTRPRSSSTPAPRKRRPASTCSRKAASSPAGNA